MNTKITYLIIRLGVGASMFGHGLVRLPKLHAFSEWMLKSFEKAMLPEMMVLPFSYVLPIAEFAFGIFLILGFLTRISAIAASVLMILLIFGTTLIENWGALTPQFLHLGFFAYLIQHIDKNRFSIDYSLKK
ncbi:DoxX family protein [Kriegella aquimaris]|uniref:Thiosulfate dehydrogenase [quinone] large subunit n=1 Tax=Kriegella aquimaris TaxID=192904 RepID=A0A1G9Q1L0_9FLAO|nr:DoxX family protein [Kriegella aquimaris]SDM04942.1 thiosulfate dehydrogenase [quinone] large subunit [Kriegella aquimaris]